ncbi:sensor histidine kinase [Actinophytocola sp.]|uniref:sensor histidine kinase n=1 Tax=Actinophytocola sp. TaxID=1872138 RepID=UPI002ED669C5
MITRARLDLALTAVVLVAQLWPFVFRVNLAGTPWHWWGYVAVAVATLPLLWRRRAPVAALLVSLVATGSYDLAGHAPSQPVWYAGLVAMYTVAAVSGEWQRLAALGLTVGGGFLVGSADTALRSGVLFVAAYAVGRASAAAHERAAWLERERRLEGERAAERERARIARDMHDVLSHAVSLMVVQAEAGPVVLQRDRARAEAAFDAIAEAGRDAMVQLRRMLTVLKEDGEPRAPAPTLDDLPTLAEQASGAGLTMTYTVSGRPLPVSPDVEIAAYRIAQEAVTNIVKHSGARHASLTIGWHDGTLTVEITDDGTRAPRSSSGYGLIGIRERAAACGGTTTIGPRPDGPGFRVSARLPAGLS